MHRQWLIDKLNAYLPANPADRECRDRILAFVRENPDCFHRTLTIGHITGSAWLLDPTGTKTLLTHHRKLGKWLQLGGHSDGNPNTLDAALREAREESGIQEIVPLSEDIFDVDIHEIPTIKNETAHYHYDVRFLFKAAHDRLILSEESLDLKWFTADEIEHLETDESVLRMVDKWKSLPIYRGG